MGVLFEVNSSFRYFSGMKNCIQIPVQNLPGTFDSIIYLSHLCYKTEVFTAPVLQECCEKYIINECKSRIREVRLYKQIGPQCQLTIAEFEPQQNKTRMKSMSQN
jgi:hypothetical protein